MKRDRAEGWRHAKLSGHQNEAKVLKLFSDEQFCDNFSKRLGVARVVKAAIGGLHERNVEGINGKTTKSKTDLVLSLEDGSFINISIKKSGGGQVYLIGVEAFIEGFEKHFGKSIPDSVKESLFLYFYGHPDIDQLLEKLNKGLDDKIKSYQLRKKRLTWTTLCMHSERKAYDFKNWIEENVDNIADFCFARGLAQNSDDWADFVWYINTVGESDFDYIFNISDIKKAVKLNFADVVIGRNLGGSTILLPFGFVQWHQQKMQFHHSLDKLLQIVNYR